MKLKYAIKATSVMITTGQYTTINACFTLIKPTPMSKMLGISVRSVYKRMSNPTEWAFKDAQKLSFILNLDRRIITNLIDNQIDGE